MNIAELRSKVNEGNKAYLKAKHELKGAYLKEMGNALDGNRYLEYVSLEADGILDVGPEFEFSSAGLLVLKGKTAAYNAFKKARKVEGGIDLPYIEKYISWLKDLCYFASGQKWDTSKIWVCEAHPFMPAGDSDLPFACTCGAPGMEPLVSASVYDRLKLSPETHLYCSLTPPCKKGELRNGQIFTAGMGTPVVNVRHSELDIVYDEEACPSIGDPGSDKILINYTNEIGYGEGVGESRKTHRCLPGFDLLGCRDKNGNIAVYVNTCNLHKDEEYGIWKYDSGEHYILKKDVYPEIKWEDPCPTRITQESAPLYYRISGYWKRSGEKFEDYLVCSRMALVPPEDDDDIFFYGMGPDEMRKSMSGRDDSGYEFVVTSYVEVLDV